MKRRKIIIVDDEKDYREGLSEFLTRDADVVSYSHPDAFAEAHTDASSLDGVYLIILDYRFDNFDAYDKDLMTYIRDDLAYRNKLALWSLEDDFPVDFKERFDGILPKKLMSLPEIEQCMDSKK
jgi:PleD family two-component response regulator